jgi:hypothetical protein
MLCMLNKNYVGLVFFKGVKSGVRSFKRLNQCKMLKHIELLVVIKACPMVPLSDCFNLVRMVLLVFMVFAKNVKFLPIVVCTQYV